MGLLERLLEGNEWSGDVAEAIETRELATREIARMASKVEEIEEKIAVITFHVEAVPNPKVDVEMIDWIGDLRKDQKFYLDRIALMEKCIKTCDQYITAILPKVN